MIYLLCGKGGSGKDTIARKMIELGKGNVKKIVSITTRPPRKGEVNGEDYFYVTNTEFETTDLIESREYKTEFGVWKYGTPEYKIDKAYDYVKIGTVDNYEAFVEAYGENNIIPVYIDVPSRLLEARMTKRGDNPIEIRRRLEADEIDYIKYKDTIDKEFFIVYNDNSYTIEQLCDLIRRI